MEMESVEGSNMI